MYGRCSCCAIISPGRPQGILPQDIEVIEGESVIRSIAAGRPSAEWRAADGIPELNN